MTKIGLLALVASLCFVTTPMYSQYSIRGTFQQTCGYFPAYIELLGKNSTSATVARGRITNFLFDNLAAGEYKVQIRVNNPRRIGFDYENSSMCLLPTSQTITLGATNQHITGLTFANRCNPICDFDCSPPYYCYVEAIVGFQNAPIDTNVKIKVFLDRNTKTDSIFASTVGTVSFFGYGKMRIRPQLAGYLFEPSLLDIDFEEFHVSAEAKNLGTVFLARRIVGIKLEEASQSLTLKVAPNPITDGQLSLQYQLQSNNSVRIRIINPLGQVLQVIQKDKVLGSHNERIDLCNLPNGVYYCSVQSGQEQETVKIIKCE
ncbi:MAG: T9SS type A sorting domain-containing protein [Candidatus Kapabacteria bacterium]|nr:T9SS type A sorting domain-containing protein [Candidatus Kapabacteria bacterium]